MSRASNIERQTPAGSVRRDLLRRHLAQLGGTVGPQECLLALGHLLRPSRLVEGPAIAEYEAAFARTIGVPYASSFSAARVGFFGILGALGIGVGDEVLLQVPTHIVVANAIRYTGARPVYVDCLAGSYNIDLADAARKLTSRSRVLLIQHTFGIPADMDEAVQFARRHNLVLIEDCVHALGARYDGKMAGSFGRAAFFSTEETKVVSTTMGGMVVTGDAELAAKMSDFQRSCKLPDRWLSARYMLKLLMYFALAHPYVHYYVRAVYEACGQRLPLPRPTSSEELLGRKPARYEQLLSNAQAAVGLLQLQGLEDNVRHRRMIGELYRRELAQMGVPVVAVPEKAEPAYVRFPVEVADRDQFLRSGAAHMVVGNWFDSVLLEAVDLACGDYPNGSCPQAERITKHLVNLPTHPRVTENDALRLAGLLKHQALFSAQRPPQNKRDFSTAATIQGMDSAGRGVAAGRR